MLDLTSPKITPMLEDIEEYIHNPLFHEFCERLTRNTPLTMKVAFSACTWEYGWNIKCKKNSRTLCTIYPRAGYFSILLIIGRNEKERVEAMLPQLHDTIQTTYHKTKEGNGQRWLQLDLEDAGKLYEDVLKLLVLRYEGI